MQSYQVLVFDFLSGELIRTLRGPDGNSTATSLSPDGRTPASVTAAGDVELLLPGSSKPLTLTAPIEPINAVLFSPDGNTLATASRDGSGQLWDARTGQAKAPLGGRHTGPVTSGAFSPDGKVPASGSWDKTIRLWDTRTGKQLRLLEGPDRVLSLAFDHRGQLAAGFGDNSIRLWNLHQSRSLVGKTPVVFDDYQASILIATAAPGTQDLVTVTRQGIYYAHDALLNKSAGTPRIATPCEEIEQAALSTDRDQVMMICKLRNRKLTRALFEHNVVFLWDIGPKASPEELPLGLTRHPSFTVATLAVDAPGRWVYIGDRDGQLLRWDLDQDPPSPQVILHKKKTKDKASIRGAVTALAISTAGDRLLVGNESGVLQLWSITPGTAPALDRTLRQQGAPIDRVQFDTAGKRAICIDRSGAIEAWRLHQPGSRWQTLEGHEGAVNAIASNNDGSLLLSGSDDGTARLWNLADPEPSDTSIVLRGHKGAVTTVGFGPAGHWLITGSNDNTVRLWTRKLDELIDQAKDAAGRNLTAREWRRYFPGRRCGKTFADLPSGCSKQ